MINKLAKKVDLNKDYRDEFKSINKYKLKLKDYVPIIHTKGICKFFVNIGGYPLSTKERHIRTGLLKRGLLKN